MKEKELMLESLWRQLNEQSEMIQERDWNIESL